MATRFIRWATVVVTVATLFVGLASVAPAGAATARSIVRDGDRTASRSISGNCNWGRGLIGTCLYGHATARYAFTLPATAHYVSAGASTSSGIVACHRSVAVSHVGRRVTVSVTINGAGGWSQCLIDHATVRFTVPTPAHVVAYLTTHDDLTTTWTVTNTGGTTARNVTCGASEFDTSVIGNPVFVGSVTVHRDTIPPHTTRTIAGPTLATGHTVYGDHPGDVACRWSGGSS